MTGRGYEVLAPDGIGEIAPGTELADVVATVLPDLRDGDIVVVASKVVSKAEGRVVPGDDRKAAVAAETVREVARRGDSVIAQTRHGFVMAAAGVDSSNVATGSLVLLPVDPDASARALRRGLRARLGVGVGVVVTDTFGRPWRHGQTDLAVGCAGVLTLQTFGGTVDRYGNPLAVTAPAVADELAAAADLARTKLAARPVAVVRGLADLTTEEDGEGVRALVRLGPADMFRRGSREAVADAYRRTDAEAASGQNDVAIDVALLADLLAVEARLRSLTLVEPRCALLDLPADMAIPPRRHRFVARLAMLLAAEDFVLVDPGEGPSVTVRQRPAPVG